MALVKLVRSVPEVAGGKTEAMVPEENVKAALDAGWSLSDKKADKDDKSDKDDKKSDSAKEPSGDAKANPDVEKTNKADKPSK